MIQYNFKDMQCKNQCHFYNNVVNNKNLDLKLDVCRTKTKHYKENDKKNDEYCNYL